MEKVFDIIGMSSSGGEHGEDKEKFGTLGLINTPMEAGLDIAKRKRGRQVGTATKPKSQKNLYETSFNITGSIKTMDKKVEENEEMEKANIRKINTEKESTEETERRLVMEQERKIRMQRTPPHGIKKHLEEEEEEKEKENETEIRKEDKGKIALEEFLKEEFRKEREVYEKMVGDLKKEYRDTKKVIESWFEKWDAMEKKNSELEKEIKNLNKKIEETKKKNCSLKGRIGAIEESHKVEIGKVETQRKRIKEIEAHITGARLEEMLENRLQERLEEKFKEGGFEERIKEKVNLLEDERSSRRLEEKIEEIRSKLDRECEKLGRLEKEKMKEGGKKKEEEALLEIRIEEIINGKLKEGKEGSVG